MIRRADAFQLFHVKPWPLAAGNGYELPHAAPPAVDAALFDQPLPPISYAEHVAMKQRRWRTFFRPWNPIDSALCMSLAELAHRTIAAPRGARRADGRA